MVDNALQFVVQVLEGFIVAGPAGQVQGSRGWSREVLALDYPARRIFNIINCIQNMVEVIFDIKISYFSTIYQCQIRY